MFHQDMDLVLSVASGQLKKVHINILSDEDAKNISTMVVGSVNQVSDAALGLPIQNATECKTCGAQNSRDCDGHFGLINLPCSILNPYFMSEIKQILDKICPGCKSIRSFKAKNAESSEPQTCKYCNKGSAKNGYPRMKFRVSSKDVFAKTAIIVGVHEKFIDRSSDFNLASDYWDVIPQDSAQSQDGIPANKRILSPSQICNILKDVSPSMFEQLPLQKKSIFLNSLLVTPNKHRVREFGQLLINDDNTRMYKRLVDFRGTANELSARVLDSYKLCKLRSEKLSNIARAYEKQSSTNESVSSSSGLKNIKDMLLGKRTDHSFRMVVVGDPRIKVTEIGIPLQIAENVLISDNISVRNWAKLEESCDTMLKSRGNFCVFRDGKSVTIWSKDMLHEGDSIRRYLFDGDVVLINRPPSIHQHSLIALRVKILPIDSVMSINPLICDPLRGDFDGDCLHGYVPQSMGSRVELSELVSLENQLLDGQNGRNLLSLSQDSLTGAHLLIQDGVFLDKPTMNQLQMFCPFAPVMVTPSVVKSNLRSSVWTGKQMFSMLLPEDFEFSYESDGICIRNGEVVSSSHGSFWMNDGGNNLFQCLIKEYGEKVLEFLTSAQEVLCEWLTMRGLTVSLSDLYLSSDTESRENLLDDIHFGIKEAEKLSEIGLLMIRGNEDLLMEGSDNTERKISSATQSKVELFQASTSASKSVLKDMQTLIYKFSENNNSFLTMLKAGSKGNLQKLSQHSIFLGLQHTMTPVSFSIPNELSCFGWNNHKLQINEETSDSYIPCSIIKGSFLTGLNPLECFMVSLTTRDSTFGGHADVSGTLTRKLMFFMRDLIIGYDGTVRSNHGNCVVQFNYCTKNGDGFTGGHPVGSLAALAISEAAYSALDLPVSSLESSPLLNLKKVMECGAQRNTGCKTASLFLSKRLRSHANGLEYGALEVKDHLESLILSNVVSEVKICYSKDSNSSTSGASWICHFHINKGVAKRRRLIMRSVIDALRVNSKFVGVKTKIILPKLRITCKDCSEVDTEQPDSAICISVALSTSIKGFSDLEILRDMVKPVLLQTVIKGFMEFKKVEILWKESNDESISGEPYLRVHMSDRCDRTRFWSIVVDKSLRIRNLIDWDRSHPDDIRDCGEAYGIDVAWQCFVNDLHSAINDTGKTILPEHLLVTASCLSVTGEFSPLSAKGLAHQRKKANVDSPFTLACFSKPSDCLIKAAKTEQTDGLEGCLESLAWGKTPSIGSGCHFDILYNGKGHESAMPADVYSLLKPHVERAESSEPKKQFFAKSIVSSHFNKQLSEVGIHKISQKMKRMLKEYAVNSILKEQDKSTAMKALQFHPSWEKKVGKGVENIKVGRHPEYNEKCFFIVRVDGTEEDFSNNKCISRALETIVPEGGNDCRSKEKSVSLG